MTPAALCSKKHTAGMLSRNEHRQKRTIRCRAVERLQGVREEVDAAAAASLRNCLTSTALTGFGNRTVGKVRDTYDAGSLIVIVTTDRQSAFDRLLANIPFKGQVLNQTSTWWFNRTEGIVPNALVGVPDPRVAVMKKCEVFPVEFVVRGFLTGSTETSLWTHYNNGAREYCGNKFPDGMMKNQRLSKNVITPTTKGVHKDVPVSPAEILEQDLMSEEDWNHVSQAALELFRVGQEEAAQRGMLLVDTKYEFGKDSSGKIMVIDEMHTPDSSRYWLAGSYEERLAAGKEPENIDKEFLRLWFRDNCDPYKDENLPEAPAELVTELSRRYIFLYERITGQTFQLPDVDSDIRERLQQNLDAWWQEQGLEKVDS